MSSCKGHEDIRHKQTNFAQCHDETGHEILMGLLEMMYHRLPRMSVIGMNGEFISIISPSK